MAKSRAERLEANAIDEWEVKNAVDTLIRAEEIKNNKKMMKLVDKELKARKKAIDNVELK